jgi:hypothetical protein
VRGALALAAAFPLALLTVAGCGGPAGGRHPGVTPSARAGDAGPVVAAWSLAPVAVGFRKMRGCAIGDSLTIVIDRGPDPARVLSVAVDVAGAPGDSYRVSYQVAQVRPGAQTAELGVGSSLTALRGYRLRPVAHLVLTSALKTGLSYDFVAWLHVTGVIPARWRIAGLTLRYDLAGRLLTSVFPQQTYLPPVSCHG